MANSERRVDLTALLVWWSLAAVICGLAAAGATSTWWVVAMFVVSLIVGPDEFIAED